MTPHNHREYVAGCYRCEIGRDEVTPPDRDEHGRSGLCENPRPHEAHTWNANERCLHRTGENDYRECPGLTDPTPARTVGDPEGATVGYTVKFYGSSDDLVEVEGEAPGCDEYNADQASFLVACEGDKACAVRVAYTFAGTWLVSIAPVSEGIELPFATVRAEGSYSASLTITGVLYVTRSDDG